MEITEARKVLLRPVVAVTRAKLASARHISEVRVADYRAMVLLAPEGDWSTVKRSSTASDTLSTLIRQFWENGKVLAPIGNSIRCLMPVRLSGKSKSLLLGKSVAVAPVSLVSDSDDEEHGDTALTDALRAAGASRIKVSAEPVVYGRLITGPTCSSADQVARYVSKALAFANH